MAEITGWITVNGKHVPLMDGESKTDAVKRALSKDVDTKQSQIDKNKAEADKLNNKTATYQTVKDGVKKLSSDKYGEGTYDAKTLQPVEYDNGYQVTYCQIGDKYSDAEHDALIKDFISKSSDGRVSLGKFEGTPEHSFHFKSREQAIAYAKKYNQISIWDWGKCEEIKTGGTGRR